MSKVSTHLLFGFLRPFRSSCRLVELPPEPFPGPVFAAPPDRRTDEKSVLLSMLASACRHFAASRFEERCFKNTWKTFGVLG